MPAARARTVAPATAPPRNDVYTLLLLISLVAMLVGTLLLFLDYNRYPDKKPPAPPTRAAPAAPPAPGTAPGTAAEGQQKGGGAAPVTTAPAPPGTAPMPPGNAPKGP